ncbi:hypothetical protein CIPAW_09G113800 [Carya illinoinensis]|uniref:Uncharacterized protein n=1 Tax=Carya illinoinensis TaxID=32201 RepID=A0A8T1PNS8_CARIL|nr:hypothetical protein CIPAW_09G113800 [Carya illinoinensis]
MQVQIAYCRCRFHARKNMYRILNPRNKNEQKSYTILTFSFYSLVDVYFTTCKSTSRSKLLYQKDINQLNARNILYCPKQFINILPNNLFSILFSFYCPKQLNARNILFKTSLLSKNWLTCSHAPATQTKLS